MYFLRYGQRPKHGHHIQQADELWRTLQDNFPRFLYVIPSKRFLRREGSGRAALCVALFATQYSAFGSLPY
jgi:hypothetical protein